MGALLRIVADVCRALDFAHKRGVVHRDVKPGNIRVLPDGSVKLVDFGIARLADSHMTRTGMVLGTPVFIAPEVLRTGRADHRSDLWSVGVILYQVLAGHLPFEGDSIATLAYKVVHDPLPPWPADVPPPLAEVAQRALQKDPAARYRDLAEMALAVELAAGLSGPLQEGLSVEERGASLVASLGEARRRMDARDLEGALAAARRAQALEPSSPNVLQLIDAIEARLDAVPEAASTPPTQVGGTPVPPASRDQDAAPAVPAGTAGITRLLAQHGAGVLRDTGTFGEPPGAQVACLAPGGRLLAVAGTDGAIRLWDLASQACRAVLRTPMHRRSGREAVASALAFSPDGGLLASGHVDGLARLWHVDSAEEYPVRLRHDGGVPALDFSPDARQLATGCTDGDLRLWDVVSATRGEARRALHRQPAAITAARYASAAPLLATGHANRTLRVLDAESHRLVASLRGPTDVVTLLHFDGERLIAGARDRSLRIFDVATRSQVLCLTLRAPVLGLALLEPGGALAFVTGDASVRIVDPTQGRELATLWGSADESLVGVAAPGGPAAIVATRSDGRLRVWGRAPGPEP